MIPRLPSLALIASLFHTCVQSTPAAPLKPATQIAPDPKRFPAGTQDLLTNQHRNVWPTLPWAAFGDSFASGVTYYNNFGENLDWDRGDPELIHRCRRIKDAYSPQLLNDFEWDKFDQGWANGSLPMLYFVACSGSVFKHIGGQLDDMNQKVQTGIDENGKDGPEFSDVIPEFATLTIGGNDALFYEVVSSCIFHPDFKRDYGPDYPDPNGACYEAIRNSNNEINSDDFSKSLQQAFTDIINHPKVKGKASFKTFVTGYAQFFNQDDPACDNYGLRIAFGPLMKRPLRKALNDLVLHINSKIEEVVKHSNEPKAVFVNIDSAFQGHRFCEPNDSSGYLGNRKQRINSWFWSFSIFDNYSLPPGTPPNSPLACDPDMDVNCADPQLGNPEYGSDVHGIGVYSPSDPLDSASATRTFHPKKLGHTAIKDIIKDAIRYHSINQ